jgi:hypothetical protein
MRALVGVWLENASFFSDLDMSDLASRLKRHHLIPYIIHHTYNEIRAGSQAHFLPRHFPL